MTDFIDVLAALGDLSTFGAWGYRGAAYVCSAPYRFEMHARWRKQGRVRVVVDIAGSLVMLLVELAVVAWIGSLVFG